MDPKKKMGNTIGRSDVMGCNIHGCFKCAFSCQRGMGVWGEQIEGRLLLCVYVGETRWEHKSKDQRTGRDEKRMSICNFVVCGTQLGQLPMILGNVMAYLQPRIRNAPGHDHAFLLPTCPLPLPSSCRPFLDAS